MTPYTIEKDLDELLRQHAEKPFTDTEVFGLLECHSTAFIKTRVELSQAHATIAKQEETIGRLTKPLTDARDYLSSNPLNHIGSGSQLHREFIAALANEKGDGERHRCQHCGNYDCEHHQSKGDGDGT